MQTDKAAPKQRIFRVCLTGGPCAGKTSAKAILQEKLGDRFILYFLPELAATTVNSGVVIIPSEFTHDTHTVFTEGIMKMQMEMEDYFHKIASIQKKDVIIISDRGVCDNLAYAAPETRERIFRETGWTLQKIRDERYDAVIHLVTAADGAEKYYTLENNQARTETPEVAKWIDQRTQEVWKGHPHYAIINNTSVRDFKHKIEEVHNHIFKLIDLPQQPGFQRKFLLKASVPVDKVPADLAPEVFDETFTYLPAADENEEVYVKKRVCRNTNGITFRHVRREHSKVAAERLELTKMLNGKLYEDFISLTDKKSHPVTKEVIVFVYQTQWCHIESFLNGSEKVSILRCFTVDPEKVKIPEFVEVAEDITDNKKYFTQSAAYVSAQ